MSGADYSHQPVECNIFAEIGAGSEATVPSPKHGGLLEFYIHKCSIVDIK